MDKNSIAKKEPERAKSATFSFPEHFIRYGGTNVPWSHIKEIVNYIIAEKTNFVIAGDTLVMHTRGDLPQTYDVYVCKIQYFGSYEHTRESPACAWCCDPEIPADLRMPLYTKSELRKVMRSIIER
jgi:hypothetical protein